MVEMRKTPALLQYIRKLISFWGVAPRTSLPRVQTSDTLGYTLENVLRHCWVCGVWVRCVSPPPSFR